VKIFKLPDLGEGLPEAEVREWHVAAGSTVAADQILVSVETAKALMEIPSPWSGRIERLCADVGAVVPTGSPLVEFADDTDAKVLPAGETTPKPDPQAPTPEPTNRPAQDTHADGTRAKMLLSTRMFARELGIDPDKVDPTGAEGIVTKEDVARGKAKVAERPESEERLGGIRKVMAEAMALSQREVAAVTIIEDADIEDWNDRSTTMPRLVRALLSGVRAEPALNAFYDRTRLVRRLVRSVSVGIAVDMAEGLLVPVLHNAEQIRHEELGLRIKELVSNARKRTLAPEQLRGNTITLTNFGAIAGRYSTPIVVPPTVAILGAGRVYLVPALRDNALANRRKLPLSLTFDHRALTGGEAARFFAAVIADLEKTD